MLFIDKLSGKPVYEQIVDGIERGILLGICAGSFPARAVAKPWHQPKHYSEKLRRAYPTRCHLPLSRERMLRGARCEEKIEGKSPKPHL